MPAESHTVFQAYCEECGWYGESYDYHRDADDEADDHNATEHEEVDEELEEGEELVEFFGTPERNNWQRTLERAYVRFREDS